jgi:hypothetical protein
MSEIDFDNLIETVFTAPLQGNRHYNLEFAQELDVLDLFELLLMTFTNGSKILYGNENGVVDLSTWTETHITEMCKRFHSIGYDCKIMMFPNVEEFTRSGIVTYKEIMIRPSTKLNDLYFAIQCSGVVYVIQFDFLPL